MLTTSCSGDDGEDAPYLSNTFVGAQAARPGPDNQHPVLRPRTGTANDEQYLSGFYAHTQLRVDVKGSRGALGQGERTNRQSIKLPTADQELVARRERFYSSRGYWLPS